MVRRGLFVLLSILVTLAFFASGRAAPVEQVALFPVIVTVLKAANVRAGPGTEYAIISSARAGQTLSVLGCNIDCSWYRLAEDCWIAAFLVTPSQPIVPDTPVVVITATPMPIILVGGTVVVPGYISQPTRCPQTNAEVNTYAGPSAFYPVVDTRPAGECVAVIGRNAIGDWFQLSHGMWIAVSSVIYAEPIELLAVTDGIFTPTPMPPLPPTPVLMVTVTGTTFSSGGLGLTREAWEAMMGTGIPDVLPSSQRYGELIVTFVDNKVAYIERQWSNPVSPDVALAEGMRYMPSDGQQVEVYSPSGRPETTVHLFLSLTLAMQFSADPFVNGQAGSYTIQYNNFDGQVTRMIVAPGNNP